MFIKYAKFLYAIELQKSGNKNSPNKNKEREVTTQIVL